MIVAQEYVNGAKSLALADGEDGFAPSGESRSKTYRAALQSAFLPQGFPQSVTPDYLAFQVWDTVQGLSSYVRGILSSQAILIGVGVGKEAATALNAVFSFFVRDLTGMLGGILFASYQGSGLDSYAKQWRIFADCLNDLGMAIELASPLFPQAFLLLACLGSVARAVTGVAGGATRTALTLHFACQRNAADISAKEGSQETAATMVGMVLGMGLTRLTAGSQAAAWAVFLLMTWLHIYANIRALRCLHMTSLNPPRLDLLLEHFWTEGEVLAPAGIAGRESLLAPPLQRLAQRLRLAPEPHAPISLAPPLASLGLPAQRRLARLLAGLKPQASEQQYLVVVRGEGRPGFRSVLVLLRPGASAEDVLRAYCQAQLEARRLAGAGPAMAVGQRAGADVTTAGLSEGPVARSSRGARTNAGSGVCSSEKDDGGWRMAELSPAEQQRLKQFVGRLAVAGWACDRVSLLQGDSRIAWGSDMHHE